MADADKGSGIVPRGEPPDMGVEKSKTPIEAGAIMPRPFRAVVRRPMGRAPVAPIGTL